MATARPTSSSTPRSRRHYSAAEKARLVAAAAEPGASVARIAREHGINANLLFGWRRQARQDLPLLVPPAPTLLPITLVEQPTPATGQASADGAVTGMITVECRRGTVRLEGAPDPALVRLVLETLLR